MTTTLPYDRELTLDQVDLSRFVGQIDMDADEETVQDARRELKRIVGSDYAKAWEPRIRPSGRAIQCRVFEGRTIGGIRCIVKEYLAMGLVSGKREKRMYRRLIERWNALSSSSSSSTSSPSIIEEEPPFCILIGSLYVDNSLIDDIFQSRWYMRFSNLPLPRAGHLWLVYKWDRATLQSFRQWSISQLLPIPSYLPLTAMLTSHRDRQEKWKFLRVLWRQSLEALAFLHSCGYVHRSLSSDSFWLTTKKIEDWRDVIVKVVDLGMVERIENIPNAIEDDLFRIGLCFLESTLATFAPDNKGAQEVRTLLLLKNKGSNDQNNNNNNNLKNQPLSTQEMEMIFQYCNKDFATLLTLCRQISSWQIPMEILSQDNSAPWKLILTLLSQGRLYDDAKGRVIELTAMKAIASFPEIFRDTF